MEGRIKKYRQLSPDRGNGWAERSPRHVQNRKVPVVYYLCRNRQLEHPHFIEVPLSSPKGLYLRDVIERLNILRGRGMASMYSWSCKRSYKNGFVWHDLCEDDVILPAHGNEYVLKGSEIIEESNPGRFSPAATFGMQNIKQLPGPPSCRSQDDTSSSLSMSGKENQHHDHDVSPPSQSSGSSGVSPELRGGSHSSQVGSLSLVEYKVSKSEIAVEASTQTEESVRRDKPIETCTRGVSTDDGALDGESNANSQPHTGCQKQNSEICEDSVSPALSSSSVCSSGEKTETLESLIRADASKINSFRVLQKEDLGTPSNTRQKASNMLMQLLSCGSISVKDHSFGLVPVPMYKPGFSHPKFPSPLYSTSLMLGELDCLSENPRFMGLKLEDKEYFSGSLLETKVPKEDGQASLKRSSSYNGDRTCKQQDSVDEDEAATSTRSKCLPRSIKASFSKQPRSESMRSPLSDKPRISSDGVRESRLINRDAPNGVSSNRMTEPTSVNTITNGLDYFKKQEERIIKIEERLASGARVIIESKEN